VIGAITDYFDGWFARRLKAQSKFGKFFDPLADKFLTGFAFLGFAVMSIIPVWMVLIILFRDVLATSMRFFPSKIISPIETSKAAKLKTFIQMAFIIILLFIIFLINCPIEFFPPPKLISFIYSDFVYYSMLFIVILTLWTLADYAKKYKI
jgi:CDP-diacylglycerol--glycerol-3-phosphate 3-phosphatidyltransferase